MISGEILSALSEVTEEEKRVTENGAGSIDRGIYTGSGEFVVDSAKLLEKGKLIQLRPHTRFVRFPKHRHNYIEMVYMCRGKTTHIVNGKTVELGEGEILLLSQSSVQEIMPAGAEDIAVNFIILPEFFSSNLSLLAGESVLGEFLTDCLTKGNDFSSYLHYKVADVVPIQNLVENMLFTLIKPQLFGRHILESTMSLLFLQLMNNTGSIKNSKSDYDKKLVLHALDYIEKNYADASLSQLASELNQTVFIMSRLIKQYTGATYNELVKTKRLYQASYLLSHTKTDIASVAAAVGYENRSYFYRIFKEKFGVTPKQYRLSQ